MTTRLKMSETRRMTRYFDRYWKLVEKPPFSAGCARDMNVP